FFFFFQAEDGIRDDLVTGVQTCALPISSTAQGRASSRCRRCVLPEAPCSPRPRFQRSPLIDSHFILTDGENATVPRPSHGLVIKIGRASCRERVEMWVERGDIERRQQRE